MFGSEGDARRFWNHWIHCRWLIPSSSSHGNAADDMVLYELFCVTAYSPSSAPFRDLLRSTTRLVVDNGGVVRGMQYWGLRNLPQRTRRHQQIHTKGDYFLMHFDTNPPVLSQLSSRFKVDPRVIKWTTLKLGDKLEDITPRNTAGGYNDLLFQHEKDKQRTYPGKNVMGGGRTIA